MQLNRHPVGLPNAPHCLPRVMVVPAAISGGGGGAVEESEDPLALGVAELVELLVQDHAVYLGSENGDLQKLSN